MSIRNVEARLAEITASQWGMVTTAQAERVGISRLVLARLSEQGVLERLAQGVYLDAGAPGSEFDELKAIWLSTDPSRFADERLQVMESGPVISGESASRLHNVGDLRASVHNITVPTRRQSQKRDVRFRIRRLDPGDVTVVEGLPVTTLERTIADLVDMRTDLSLVADVLASAVKRTQLDQDRLVELLGPLAARNGFKKGSGQALLDLLLEIAGLDLASLTKQLIRTPGLGESLVRALTVDETIRQVAKHMQNLEIVSPEALKKISENLQLRNLGLPAAFMTEHYQKVVRNIGIPELVGRSQRAASIQMIEQISRSQHGQGALKIKATKVNGENE